MAEQPTPRGAWLITFLLFLYMLINFAHQVMGAVRSAYHLGGWSRRRT
jgi:hypothetical protein